MRFSPSLGVGGMGEVYQARDLRLDRIVALKISKAEFTERFKQEARPLGTMMIDQRIERLVKRAALLVTKAEFHLKDRQADTERIRALAKIAERRLETL